MKKKSLDSVEEVVAEPKELKDPVLVGWSTVKTIVKLDELVKEHGAVFIINPMGLPLKVTRSELK